MDLFQQLMTAGDYTPQDMFKAVTYIGTGTERSITGVGFKPDFVWIKCRSNALEHMLYDNLRGVGNAIRSNRSSPTWSVPTTLTSFDDDGFTIGAYGETNTAGYTYVAWCFKADNDAGTSNTNGSITSTVNAGKNFSIVKYTGTGANATIGHGLPVAPKIIIYRDLTAVNQWVVYSETIGNTKNLHLNLTNAEAVNAGMFNNTSPTTELFSVGTEAGVNTLNNEYIAYCFADLEGVSKVGSYTGTGAVDNVVPCGFQPAYVMIKRTDGAGSWIIYDNKRDTHNPNTHYLGADLAQIEYETAGLEIDLTATGFICQGGQVNINTLSSEYIFLAFAELPTDDSPENHNLPLFGQIAYTGDGSAEHNITGLPFKPDLVWGKGRTLASSNSLQDSLRGVGYNIISDLTSAEVLDTNSVRSFNADGYTLGSWSSLNGVYDYIGWCWNAGGELVPNLEGSIESSVMANVQGGFSIVRWTGNLTTGATVGHGLSKSPELIIIKNLSAVYSWIVYNSSDGATKFMYLNLTAASSVNSTMFNDTEPTADVFTVDTHGYTNGNNHELIAYCWHSVAGISDMGSYVGNGNVVGPVIDCGFKPDWIMVKKTDSVGWWPIYDRRRDGDDTLTHEIHANSSNAESNTANGVQVTNIGFNPIGVGGDVNALNGNYIYMAFKAGDNPDTLHQTETGDLQISSESGSIVDDNGTHTITNTGVTVGSTDPACGTYDMVFDGIAGTDLIIPHSTDFVFGADFTIDFWATPEEIYPQEIISKRADSTSEGVAIAIIGSAWHWYAAGVNWGLGNTITPVVIDTPVHVALLRFGSYWLTYINGVQQSSLFSAGSITDNGADLSVGLNHVGFGTYKGKLDQVRITKGTALWTTTNFNLTDKGLFYPSGTLNI